MKRNRLKLSLFTVTAVFFGTSLKAQLVDDRAFMIGDFVEIGINPSGYEGAELVDTIPTHARGFTGKLGFVANPQADGWINYDGDFYLPGSPENGFGLTYTLLDSTYHRANNAMGLADIPGSITSVIDNVDSTIVLWEGTIDDLEIDVMYELQKDQHSYSTKISITNVGAETFTDMYYYRTLDPDNNQDISWGFATTNTIETQAGMSDDTVRVSAVSDVTWLSEMVFHTYGANWRGFTGGFSNRNGSAMWNGTASINVDEGYSNTADQAIGLAYKVGTLAPGKAGSDVFSFETVFNREEFYAAMEEDDSGINEYNLDFKLFPNPTENKTTTITVDGNFEYQIIDASGKLVKTGYGNNVKKLDLNALDNGIYIIHIHQEEKIAKQKIILQ